MVVPLRWRRPDPDLPNLPLGLPRPIWAVVVPQLAECWAVAVPGSLTLDSVPAPSMIARTHQQFDTETGYVRVPAT